MTGVLIQQYLSWKSKTLRWKKKLPQGPIWLTLRPTIKPTLQKGVFTWHCQTMDLRSQLSGCQRTWWVPRKTSLKTVPCYTRSSLYCIPKLILATLAHLLSKRLFLSHCLYNGMSKFSMLFIEKKKKQISHTHTHTHKHTHLGITITLSLFSLDSFKVSCFSPIRLTNL